MNENIANQADDKAVIKDKTAYNKPIKSVPKPDPNVGVDFTNGVASVLAQSAASQIDIATINSFTQISERRDQLYTLLDNMCEDSIIAAILETYAEDATEYNDDNQIVWVESQDAKINKYINFLIQSMQIDKNIYKWVYSLCKYGDVYVQLFRQSEIKKDKFFNKAGTSDKLEETKSKSLNEDININLYKDKVDHYEHYVEMVPNPAEMFELTKFGKTCGYIKTNITAQQVNTQNVLLGNTQQYIYRFKQSDIDTYNGDKFVHASLEDGVTRTPEEVELFLDNQDMTKDTGVKYIVKRGQSLFYNVFKIWRELSLLENSMLLNRITKSAIVRLISVEVGDMPKEMVGPYLQGIKSLMEQKSAINAGESISEYTNPGPIENNIYVPTHNGQGAITADQVGGDVNISQLPDIDYFQNKFFGSTCIPKQYFGLTEDGAGFNGGQSLAIISSRYAKRIKRIQSTITQLITTIIDLMLVDKGMTSYIGNYTIKMQSPTTQEEIERRDAESSKVGITRDLLDITTQNIDDPIAKLKIMKTLVSNVVTDADVLDLIEDEISRLEKEQEEGTLPEETEGEDLFSDNEDLGGSEPLNLDTELNLSGGETSTGEFEAPEEETAPSEEAILPSPEELGVGDMSDNTNTFETEET